MKLFVFLWIICINAFHEDEKKNQCGSICPLDISEIDVSKFLDGTDDEKRQIAVLFDQAFHQYGIIRLINTDLSTTIIDKAKEFFALDTETKMKYYVNGSYYETPGYKPPGLEAVGNYKGEKNTASTDSNEVFFHFFKSQSNAFDFPVDQLPDVFREVLPVHMRRARQLISHIHRIADLALGLKENTLDKDYTNDHAIFHLRLAKYFPPNNNDEMSLGEHQDYLGFTLIQNDDVPGLEVHVNGEWFRVESKKDTVLVVGGEFISKWTNDYWISALHRVAAVDQLRYSALLFSGPDLNSVIGVLPCEKCTQKRPQYPPIIGYQHIEQRRIAVTRQ